MQVRKRYHRSPRQTTWSRTISVGIIVGRVELESDIAAGVDIALCVVEIAVAITTKLSSEAFWRRRIIQFSTSVQSMNSNTSLSSMEAEHVEHASSKSNCRQGQCRDNGQMQAQSILIGQMDPSRRRRNTPRLDELPLLARKRLRRGQGTNGMWRDFRALLTEERPSNHLSFTHTLKFAHRQISASLSTGRKKKANPTLDQSGVLPVTMQTSWPAPCFEHSQWAKSGFHLFSTSNPIRAIA